jgi:hypothetical protein
MRPIFLDCEASSLSHDSYPIEIAWSDEQGNIESHLINPYGYPKDYTDWAPDAQAIHGLSRNFLSKKGKHPEVVANRLNQALKGKVVYTDAPDFDGMWVNRLLDAVNMKRSFEFGNVESLLRKNLPMEYWLSDSSGRFHVNALYVKARKQCGLDAHRAANDVAYLLELYRISREVGGYYG